MQSSTIPFSNISQNCPYYMPGCLEEKDKYGN